MDLLSYFRALRRRWWAILLLTVLGAGLGVASTQIESKDATKARTYSKATTTLILRASNGSNAFPSTFGNLDQIALLTTTGPVPDDVADALGSSASGRQLAQRITTLTNPTTSTLDITAIDADPDRAVQLSNAFADALDATLTETDQTAYDEANATAKAKVDSLQGRIDGLLAQIAANPPNVDVLKNQLLALNNQYTAAFGDLQDVASQDRPGSPLRVLAAAHNLPISRSEYQYRLRQGELNLNNMQIGTAAAQLESATSNASLGGPVPRGLLGAFFGLLAGIGLALLLERLDRKIRTHDDAEAAFGLPVLADVPDLPQKQREGNAVVAFTQPLSRTAEAYRAVRSAVLFQLATDSSSGYDFGSMDGRQSSSDVGHEALVLMITSPAPREGKTSSTANLAAVFAEAGSSVLVVNCDFRRPMVHRYLGVADASRKVHRSTVPGVRVVSNVTDTSEANPARVVAAQRNVVQAAKSQFDVILLDTAPLLSANDAVELIGETDLVLLVARADLSSTPGARRAMEILRRVDAPAAGVVFVGSDDASNEYYYYEQRSASAGDRSSGRRASRKMPDEPHNDEPGTGTGSGSNGHASPVSDPAGRTRAAE